MGEYSAPCTCRRRGPVSPSPGSSRTKALSKCSALKTGCVKIASTVVTVREALAETYGWFYVKVLGGSDPARIQFYADDQCYPPHDEIDAARCARWRCCAGRGRPRASG